MSVRAINDLIDEGIKFSFTMKFMKLTDGECEFLQITWSSWYGMLSHREENGLPISEGAKQISIWGLPDEMKELRSQSWNVTGAELELDDGDVRFTLEKLEPPLEYIMYWVRSCYEINAIQFIN
jgi:hypothetical protein